MTTAASWDMPAGLNGVKAISASRTLGAAPSFYSLALKSDGTVVGWGTDAGTGAGNTPRRPHRCRAPFPPERYMAWR